MIRWIEDWLACLLRREMARQRACMLEALTDSNPARQRRMLKEARSPFWFRIAATVGDRLG